MNFYIPLNNFFFSANDHQRPIEAEGRGGDSRSDGEWSESGGGDPCHESGNDAGTDSFFNFFPTNIFDFSETGRDGGVFGSVREFVHRHARDETERRVARPVPTIGVRDDPRSGTDSRSREIRNCERS